VNVWRRERREPLDDIVEYLRGLARMLQSIDARLEQIVNILKENDEEA
jgi:hypothetical protein